MRKYAEDTKVPVESSQAEIIGLLKKHGIQEYGSAMTPVGTSLWFRHGGIMFKLEIRVAQDDTEQEQRRKWRALVLVVKAKLVAAQDGITTIEREFLPFIVTDDGSTFADRFMPSLIESAKALNGRVSVEALALPARSE